jgi:hypothetical protein
MEDKTPTPTPDNGGSIKRKNQSVDPAPKRPKVVAFSCKSCTKDCGERQRTKIWKNMENEESFAPDLCIDCGELDYWCPDGLSCSKANSCSCGHKHCEKCLFGCIGCQKVVCRSCEGEHCSVCKATTCKKEKCRKSITECSSENHEGDIGFCDKCAKGKDCSFCGAWYCSACMKEKVCDMCAEDEEVESQEDYQDGEEEEEEYDSAAEEEENGAEPQGDDDFEDEEDDDEFDDDEIDE